MTTKLPNEIILTDRESVMTKNDKCEVLQDWVSKNYLTTDKALQDACRHEQNTSGVSIDWFEDVLAPMGWNCCDRCGALGDAELDFAWVDYMDYEYDEQILDAITKEGGDYCAVCWKCCEELKKKGK